MAKPLLTRVKSPRYTLPLSFNHNSCFTRRNKNYIVLNYLKLSVQCLYGYDFMFSSYNFDGNSGAVATIL